LFKQIKEIRLYGVVISTPEDSFGVFGTALARFAIWKYDLV
jgi:hypothetical protein